MEILHPKPYRPKKEKVPGPLPARGEFWQHKKTKRVCVVKFISKEPWNLVEYRYVAPPDHTRGRGEILERTNTTARTITRFLENFVRMPPNGPLGLRKG